jgi:hypothetical protein
MSELLALRLVERGRGERRQAVGRDEDSMSDPARIAEWAAQLEREGWAPDSALARAERAYSAEPNQRGAHAQPLGPTRRGEMPRAMVLEILERCSQRRHPERREAEPESQFFHGVANRMRAELGSPRRR